MVDKVCEEKSDGCEGRGSDGCVECVEKVPFEEGVLWSGIVELLEAVEHETGGFKINKKT